jgi:hypothetical protein
MAKRIFIATFGFGSMPLGQMKKRAPVLAEVLRRSGQRAVLARDWGGWREELLASLGGQVHIIGSNGARIFLRSACGN